METIISHPYYHFGESSSQCFVPDFLSWELRCYQFFIPVDGLTNQEQQSPTHCLDVPGRRCPSLDRPRALSPWPLSECPA